MEICELEQKSLATDKKIAYWELHKMKIGIRRKKSGHEEMRNRARGRKSSRENEIATE